MAAPMRAGSQDATSGHRARVADSTTNSTTTTTSTGAAGAAQSSTVEAPTQQPSSANFEYDDNEWDIGIGDLIIDLDADIEKTNDQQQQQQTTMASSNSGAGVGGPNAVSLNSKQSAAAAAAAAAAKMHIEHSATADKGLKMKIKRTKPGTKTSEAKHEIVKSAEQNGTLDQTDPLALPPTKGGPGGPQGAIKGGGQPPQSIPSAASTGVGASAASQNSGGAKRGSSGHRRDKGREKHVHGSSSNSLPQQSGPGGVIGGTSGGPMPNSGISGGGGVVAVDVKSAGKAGVHGAGNGQSVPSNISGGVAAQSDMRGASNSAGGSSGANSGAASSVSNSNSDLNGLLRGAGGQVGLARSVFPSSTGPGPPSSGIGNSSQNHPVSIKCEPGKSLGSTASGSGAGSAVQDGDQSNSPPPNKKIKTESKEVTDVCVGTSVGTITEPDCLGPCEPGTSVTLEGIVWHETEGGILVVNVTWRGKTYVGTLLDCTRHDWAPPRFCDSPTDDLDSRTPKGRETRSTANSKLRNGGPGGKGGRRGVANGAGAAAAPASPTPFVPPRPDNKRKTRVGEEEQNLNGKKAKVVVPSQPTPAVLAAAPPPAGSPPPSPVLLECPEPNCSKKYKHINGLKYHQSRAHGSAPTEDEDTKDVTSTSENDESNIEAPSPITPAKSPEKSQDSSSSPPTPVKKELPTTDVSSALSTAETTTGTQATPRSTPPSPSVTPQNTPSEPPAVVPLSPITTPVESSKPPLGSGVVKPGILRYGTEEYPQGPHPQGPHPQGTHPQGTHPQATHPQATQQPGVYAVSGKPAGPGAPVSNQPQLNIPGRPGPPTPNEQMSQPAENHQPQSFSNQLPPHMPPQQFTQPPNLVIPSQQNPQMQSQMSPRQHPVESQSQAAKLAQFKVKPTSALMPEDKKAQQQLQHQQQQQQHQQSQQHQQAQQHQQPQQQQQQQPQNCANLTKVQSFKKKNRKTPDGSPHPPQSDQPMYGMEQGGVGRDEVQSPAYSDISDDGAPVIDAEPDKTKPQEKKTEPGQPLPHMSQYGIYPFYSQNHQYLVPQGQQQQQHQPVAPPEGPKPKEPEKPAPEKQPSEKESKKDGEYPQQKMLSQHYYPPYGYIPPGYPYNMDPNYPGVQVVPEDKHKEDRTKESPSPIEQPNKQPGVQGAPIPNPIHVPMPKQPGKPDVNNPKDKHQNENHQIIKESIEIKNQMNPYMYSRQQPQAPQQQPVPAQHHNQREEDARRFYMYSEQRRKEQHQQQQQQHQQPPPSQPPQQPQVMPDHRKSGSDMTKMPMPQQSNIKNKEIKLEDKKVEKEIKQEGVKPTMETQGPPPPPTSQYAYIHPSYMQSPHYGALPFDPNHPMYRGIMVPGPYGNSPYLHQIPRYHAPEDLSRAQPPTKALDMLQHHAQYYSSHKIHELQERAIKSPTPKTTAASASPSTNSAQPPQSPAQMNAPPTSQPPPTTPTSGKQTPGDSGKDSRSPPPQRHVHTHHHTHVGLGYPMYPAPYGAAVLASQQAAAVTVINPYPTK